MTLHQPCGRRYRKTSFPKLCTTNWSWLPVQNSNSILEGKRKLDRLDRDSHEPWDVEQLHRWGLPLVLKQKSVTYTSLISLWFPSQKFNWEFGRKFNRWRPFGLQDGTRLPRRHNQFLQKEATFHRTKVLIWVSNWLCRQQLLHWRAVVSVFLKHHRHQ